MKTILFWVAVTGWVLGLLVHVLSIFDVDVQTQIPYIWLLHLGIFVVWIPAILTLRKSESIRMFENPDTLKRMNPIAFFKVICEKTPVWIVVIAAAGLFYAFVNFLLFMTMQTGTPALKDGQYYLHNHGKLIRNITEQEYHHYKASLLRGFSGHWIAFYGIAAAVLYPFRKEPVVISFSDREQSTKYTSQ